jgi:hypothetical protein
MAKQKRKSSGLLQKFSFSPKTALPAVALLAIFGSIAVISTRAAINPYDTVGQAKLINNPKRGLVYDGLKKVKSNAFHSCKGAFEVEGVKLNDQPSCTHGPDAAPPNVDMSTPVTQDAVTTLKSLKLEKAPRFASPKTDQEANQIIESAGVATNFADLPVTTPRCYGNGTDGKRVQLIYAYTGVIDRNQINFITAAMSTEMAGRLETMMLRSSSNTRHIRFQTNANCQPTVRFIPMPYEGDIVTFEEMEKVMQSNGLTSTNRKYLIWTNYRTPICGQATVENDSQSSIANNKNNLRTGYAVVGQKCWFYAEPHEMMHNLGAVQLNAPHTSGGWHCTDDNDEMCYNDNADGTSTVNGKGTTIRCSAAYAEIRYDCVDDDYFNSGSPIPTSNYLHNHWNTANSPYLAR